MKTLVHVPYKMAIANSIIITHKLPVQITLMLHTLCVHRMTVVVLNKPVLCDIDRFLLWTV